MEVTKTTVKTYTADLYVVVLNTDTTEGRGRAYYQYYTCREVAEAAAKGAGTFGSDAPVRTSREVVVEIEGVDGPEFFRLGQEICATYEDPREVRARAISKLTDAERKALGV